MDDLFDRDGYLKDYVPVEQLLEIYPIGSVVLHRNHGLGEVVRIESDRDDLIILKFPHMERVYEADPCFIKKAVTRRGNKY